MKKSHQLIMTSMMMKRAFKKDHIVSHFYVVALFISWDLIIYNFFFFFFFYFSQCKSMDIVFCFVVVNSIHFHLFFFIVDRSSVEYIHGWSHTFFIRVDSWCKGKGICDMTSFAYTLIITLFKIQNSRLTQMFVY
jgi:hypothetical protein